MTFAHNISAVPAVALLEADFDPPGPTGRLGQVVSLVERLSIVVPGGGAFTGLP